MVSEWRGFPEDYYMDLYHTDPTIPKTDSDDDGILPENSYYGIDIFHKCRDTTAFHYFAPCPVKGTSRTRIFLRDDYFLDNRSDGCNEHIGLSPECKEGDCIIFSHISSLPATILHELLHVPGIMGGEAV
jgi:hypothetical protein